MSAGTTDTVDGRSAPAATGRPTMVAMRAGLSRGMIEFRQTLTNASDLSGYLIPTLIFLVVMTFMKGSTVPGTTLSLGSMALPSVLGMSIAFGGMVGLAQALVVEREDGTLLRAKAVPNGALGYLLGKIVQVSGMSVISLAIILIPGAFLFDGLDLSGVYPWLTVLWVFVLGSLATLPIGAVFGSLFSSPRQTALIMLPMMALIGISGIFYPISSLPHWLQIISQIFPVYWLGLGMRSALLPDGMSVAEIDQSWRHLEMIGVLGAWAIVGMIVAPIILRRMARRESGSSVEARRQKAMQRIT